MREMDVGQWTYFTWHLPTLVLIVGATALTLRMGASLWRDDLTASAARLRWSVLGWSAVGAALLSAIVWPYLAAFSTIRVGADGQWVLTNYLGVPLARIPAAEVRGMRAEDLGGLGWGSGRLHVRRADGTTLDSVRFSGQRFASLREAMGYPRDALREANGAVIIPAHVYSPSGPRMVIVRSATSP